MIKYNILLCRYLLIEKRGRHGCVHFEHDAFKMNMMQRCEKKVCKRQKFKKTVIIRLLCVILRFVMRYLRYLRINLRYVIFYVKLFT